MRKYFAINYQCKYAIGLFGSPKINDFEHFLPKIFDQLKKLRRKYFQVFSPQLLTFSLYLVLRTEIEPVTQGFSVFRAT